MKARYEVPGIGKKDDSVPEGRLKYALTYARRFSRLSRIRRPSGTQPFFVRYPGNKLPGYYHSVPPGGGRFSYAIQPRKTSGCWLPS
jgi:hypothetical protein